MVLSTWGLHKTPLILHQLKSILVKLAEIMQHVIWWSAPSTSKEVLWQFLGLFILKLTPLTDRQSSPSILDLLDHFVKFLLFVFSQKFVIFNAGNIQLVLGFWLWGLKWAGQDGEFDIFQDLVDIKINLKIVKCKWLLLWLEFLIWQKKPRSSKKINLSNGSNQIGVVSWFWKLLR